MPTAFANILESVPAGGVPIESLVDLANEALDLARVAVDDGRASERLDVRTVRFYQTLGILPKPDYEGRRAFYGREHLIRAVAAKRLQAEGYSLAQIQSALPAQTLDELAQALLALDASPRRTPPATQGDPPLLRGARSTASARALLAFEVAPGITVTIDPALVADPDAVADLLRHAMPIATPDQTPAKPGPNQGTHARRPHGGNT